MAAWPRSRAAPAGARSPVCCPSGRLPAARSRANAMAQQHRTAAPVCRRFPVQRSTRGHAIAHSGPRTQPPTRGRAARTLAGAGPGQPGGADRAGRQHRSPPRFPAQANRRPERRAYLFPVASAGAWRYRRFPVRRRPRRSATRIRRQSSSLVQLIPVVDLLGGCVVRAVRGERASYRPVVSALCPTAEPIAVARTLLDYCRSAILYVADLDGLTNGVAQHALLAELCRALPATEIWLDAGFARFADAQALLARLAGARVTAILASEALVDTQQLKAAGRSAAPWIASLDRKGGHMLDRADCWQRSDLWPQRVIVMTLDRVGAMAGPDLVTFGGGGAAAGTGQAFWARGDRGRRGP